jgi:hypothetical protein
MEIDNGTRYYEQSKHTMNILVLFHFLAQKSDSFVLFIYLLFLRISQSTSS